MTSANDITTYTKLFSCIRTIEDEKSFVNYNNSNLIENIRNELWDERFVLDTFTLDQADVEDCLQSATPEEVFVNLRRLSYAKKKERIIDLILAAKVKYDEIVASILDIHEVVSDEVSDTTFILDKDDVEDCLQSATPEEVFVNLRRLSYAKKKERVVDLILAVKAEYDNHIAALTAIPEVVTDRDSFYFHDQVEKLLEQMKNSI